MEWFEILKNALFTGFTLIRELLTRTLFTLGEKTPITLEGIFYFLISILLLIYLTDKFQKKVVHKVNL